MKRVCVKTLITCLRLAQANCHRNSASFMVAKHKVDPDPACAILPFFLLLSWRGSP